MILNTARVPWAVLRGEVTVDDTPLTSSDRNDWPAGNVVKLFKPPLHDANACVVAFHGTDAADETVNYKIRGVNKCNGPIQLLLEGAITLGTLAATVDPIDLTTVIANGLWADTITVTGGLLSGAEDHKILNPGQNGICELMFDQKWWDEIKLEIDIPAASQVASIYGIISGY